MEWVYNKGRRTWDIPVRFNEDGLPNEHVVIEPGRAKEMPKEVADRYVARYPLDLIYGQGDHSEQSKAGKRIAALEKENEALKAEIAELKSGGPKMDQKTFLLQKAEEVGVEVDKRWGIDKLREVISEAETE